MIVFMTPFESEKQRHVEKDINVMYTSDDVLLIAHIPISLVLLFAFTPNSVWTSLTIISLDVLDHDSLLCRLSVNDLLMRK